MKYTRKTMHLGAQPGMYANARELRKNVTNAEALLWGYLRDRRMEGIKFRQQHPILRYIVDFYAHELKLVIEIDGNVHLDDMQARTDQLKRRHLEEHDIWLIRFTNNDVINKTDMVLSAIRKKVNELKERKERFK